MAIIRFEDGTIDNVTPEIGGNIWLILNGHLEPTDEQANYCDRVSQVLLNWRTAPDEYIKANYQVIMEMALGDWMCDYQGRLTRPQPNDKFGWEFAKKWGLWEHGSPSMIALMYSKQHDEKIVDPFKQSN